MEITFLTFVLVAGFIVAVQALMWRVKKFGKSYATGPAVGVVDTVTATHVDAAADATTATPTTRRPGRPMKRKTAVSATAAVEPSTPPAPAPADTATDSVDL